MKLRICFSALSGSWTLNAFWRVLFCFYYEIENMLYCFGFGSKCSISSDFDGGFSSQEVRVHGEVAEVS